MSTPSESLRRMALAEDDGARLDVAVGRRFPSISRRVARRLALEGKIHLDGIASPPSTRVRAGQVLAICVRTGPREVPGASILQVSERFVYAFKPAGVHTHRLRPDEDASLADFVTDAHPECADASDASREGGALHRLDFATSGVVAFARSADAWAEGRALFSRGLVSKHYLAVSTWGNAPTRRWPPELPEGAFDAWLRPWSNAGGDGQ
ncbi:MAG: pseudouridine synthase, partial [Nannocystaceae bacterium]